jgi:hypothetical protein
LGLGRQPYAEKAMKGSAFYLNHEAVPERL